MLRCHVDNGRILQRGPLAELLDRPASARTACLLGLRNLFPAARTAAGWLMPALGVQRWSYRSGDDGFSVYVAADSFRVGSPSGGEVSLSGRIDDLVPGPCCTRLRIR